MTFQTPKTHQAPLKKRKVHLITPNEHAANEENLRCIPLVPMPGAPTVIRPKASNHHAVEDWQPDFQSLVNYPKQQHVRVGGNASLSSSSSSGFRATGNCVMCNKTCLLGSASAKHNNTCSVNSKQEEDTDELLTTASQTNTSGEIKRFITVQQAEEEQRSTPSKRDDKGLMANIPKQNKGLCTNCDITVWVIAKNGLMIKWCKGCKNFRLWEAFGAKGRATKCTKCRTRQREKYASQKELRKKQKSPDTVIHGPMRRMCHDFDAAQAALSLTELSK